MRICNEIDIKSNNIIPLIKMFLLFREPEPARGLCSM